MTANRPSSSIKETEDPRKSSKIVSKQETKNDESDIQSTEEPEEPTILPKHRPAVPLSRRFHPVSQTRSYHSILDSLRGTVRNRGLSRKRDEDSEEEEKEHEEEEEETPATTPATEVTTTIEVVVETKEIENTISYDAKDTVGYNEESPTTKIPSLKVLTPSPTKVSIRPPRRPIKIRVHQKPGSKGSSLTTSSKSTMPSSPPASPPLTSTPSTSKTSLSTSTPIVESAERQNNRVAFEYPQSKVTHDKPSVTYRKPAAPTVKQPNSQQAEASSKGKGSAPTGRASGTGFGSRYGYSRRYPFLRGNSTRILNGYKPSVTSQFNGPRTSSQAGSKPHSSATSQSTLPDRTRDHKTSETFDSTTPKTNSQSESDDQEKTDLYSNEKAQNKPDYQTHGSSSSQSVSKRGSNSPAVVHNTHSSHTSAEQDTEIGNASDDHKNLKETKVEEPTSSSRPKPVQQERKNKEEREETRKENTGVSSNTRISPSLAERFPWLASRYPVRFASSRLPPSRANGRATATRTSSSIGANTPILRETPTRFSGAAGASGVSRIQETRTDVKNHFSDDTNNGARIDADKSLANQNSVSINPVNPGLSTSIATSSTGATSSNSKTDDFLERPETSSENMHTKLSHENKNDHTKDYLKESSTQTSEKSDKATDLSSHQKNSTMNLDSTPKTIEENLNKYGNTSSRTRFGSTQASRNYPRRGFGFNGRAYPSVMGNRQFSGSRLPIRTQLGENTRTSSSESQSSQSSTGSSSSSVQQPVVTSGQTTNIGSDSKPISSASSASSRNGLRGRTRFPGLRGKPTNGGQFKPDNGNGNSK